MPSSRYSSICSFPFSASELLDKMRSKLSSSDYTRKHGAIAKEHQQVIEEYLVLSHRTTEAVARAFAHKTYSSGMFYPDLFAVVNPTICCGRSASERAAILHVIQNVLLDCRAI